MATPKQSNRDNYFKKKWQYPIILPAYKKRIYAFNEQESKKNETNQSPEISHKKRKIKSEKWTAIGTIILAVATIVLAFYTYQLFSDASTANERNKGAIEAA